MIPTNLPILSAKTVIAPEIVEKRHPAQVVLWSQKKKRRPVMMFLIKTLGFKESLRVEVRFPSKSASITSFKININILRLKIQVTRGTNDKLITVIEGKIEEFNRSYRY